MRRLIVLFLILCSGLYAQELATSIELSYIPEYTRGLEDEFISLNHVFVTDIELEFNYYDFYIGSSVETFMVHSGEVWFAPFLSIYDIWIGWKPVDWFETYISHQCIHPVKNRVLYIHEYGGETRFSIKLNL